MPSNEYFFVGFLIINYPVFSICNSIGNFGIIFFWVTYICNGIFLAINLFYLRIACYIPNNQIANIITNKDLIV